MKTLVMCPFCKDVLEGAGYEAKELESCEKREKCFWCNNRGYFSRYRTRRVEDAANRGEERTEEGAMGDLPVPPQHQGADYQLRGLL